MKIQDFYNEEQELFDAEHCGQNMNIRHLLEPMHAPKCEIEFKPQERTRKGIVYRLTHFSTVAAALIIGLLIGVNINQSYALKNEKIINTALEKQESAECIYTEGITRIRTYTLGELPNHRLQHLGNEVKYKMKAMRKNGKVYFRTEYGDKNSTVEIFDGENLSVWANGEHISDLPISKINTPMFSIMNLDNAISHIKEVCGISSATQVNGDKIVLSYKPKNSDRYVAYTFSKKDKVITSAMTYTITNNNIVILQSIEKFVFDNNLSVEEILAEPK